MSRKAPKVNIDQLADVLTDQIKKYADVTTDEMKQAVRDVAKECRNQIKQKSPRLTGDYAKGWRTEKAFENANELRMNVKNATDWQLTHLLEYGHVVKNKKDGRELGMANAHPHIRPAELKAQKELVKKIEKAVKG